MIAADFGDCFHLLLVIHGAIFRRLGKINNTGLYHMLNGGGFLILTQTILDLLCRDLSVLLRKSEDLVPRRLHSAGLVNVDVPRGSRYSAFKRAQDRRDHHQVRLSPSHNKMDLRIRCVTRLPDQSACLVTPGITAVPRRLLKIGVLEQLHNLRMRSFPVIAFKTNHSSYIIPSFSCSYSTLTPFSRQESPLVPTPPGCYD